MRKLGAGHARSALVIALIVIASRADATVTQVDGQIVPVTNRLQVFLDAQEGAGVIDGIVNAAQLPQIFRPNLAQPVVFLDVGEGAGFESSFGYYNIGDDVLTAAGRVANLHPILGCGVTMLNAAGTATTHSGDPTAYVLNAEPGSQISVNFASEKAAGRYKGGFIGFYLITPESNPSANNCGDFKNGTDNLSLFGFIYYTQKDLNNDGDFVHHLVYQSPAAADRFYFGFEDLFRGGDNDFEDMLIRVDGLTPPCVPQAEICDGIDNDCDGLVDAADPDLTGVNNVCTCDGVALTCENGPQFGQCQSGVTQCKAATIVCHATGQPAPEICDGIDNNCNQVVDDNPSGTGAACDGADADSCPEGQIVCSMGQLVCNDNTGNNIETCNGIDDNCNGQIDEGNPGGGGSCGSSIGVCTPGTFVCQGGGLVCVGSTGGTPEKCNGLDDNCDGVVDNNPTDVGMSCGTTNVGECEFGQTICVGGTLQCAGQVGPTTETCNNKDDNCNGVVDDMPVDAGQPCGSSIGECDPGVLVCSAGGVLVCQGGVGPAAETCDGKDNDCNGLVDDMVPGEGVACGAGGMGPCAAGMTKCINGSMQCVGGATTGTEVCNNIDDDCDGLIDEGDLCNGGICDNGGCAAPCIPGEFPCPTGKKCQASFCVDDPCYGITCPADANGNVQSCQAGTCQPVCPTVTCQSGFVCRGSDGACVPDTCAYVPNKCNASELCVNNTCQPNACFGVTCPGDKFCRDGVCIGSCQGVQCMGSEVCRDGTCQPSGCATNCGTQVCNPVTGQCQNDKCTAGVQCAPTEVCDPLTGGCITDPCQGVTCPTGQACKLGQCGDLSNGQFVTTGGGGGCDASGGAGGDRSLFVVFAVAALLLMRRRAGRQVVAVGVSLTMASIALAGCGVNEFCLDCKKPMKDAGPGGGDGGDGDAPDAAPMCDPNQIHPETCNHIDDDCNGVVDDGFDLMSDSLNCGACGNVCNKAGAQTKCVAGACTILGCFPGFTDKNMDTGGPYSQSDGCEYQCFQSNGGVEACDNLDNDCDGNIDEGINLTNDVNNCGLCGRRCDFFSATPTCSNSVCSFNPSTDCAAGFVDADMMQADGCEYQCTKTNGGVEACDVRDNDCDGLVDETFNLQTDRNNCGGCGRVCSFPHVIMTACAAGTCGYNKQTDCQPGFVDVNGMQLDGCEYACTKTNGGIEKCDGIDNNCDGIADNMTVDSGGACASVSPPKGACVANGVLTCSAGVLVCSGATDPVVETCDNVDQDCNGVIDNGVTQTCYTGPMNTNGIGRCHGGTATCAAGTFGACTNQVTPVAEICNSLDDNCDGMVDNAAGGGPITQTCYSGPAATMNVGTCRSGTKTCSFGAFGSCAGEVVPRTEICGDGLNTDCDLNDDTMEGCLFTGLEQRLDAAGGALGTAVGAQHSYDVVLASGGTVLGTNVYAAWSELVGGVTEIYFRASTDGGLTWGTIINVTSGVAPSAVKPLIAVAQGTMTTPDRVVIAYQTVSGGVRDIRVQVSADAGATFGSATGALDAAGDSFHHAVAISGNTVVVAWEKLDTATLNRDVMSATSTDGGTTFSVEKKINVGSGATRFAGRPQVGITSTGGVVWTWREQRNGATRDMFAASVAAATSTPSADVRIDSDGSDNRDSDFPVLKVAGTSAYLVWQDVSTNAAIGADVQYSRSLDGGATWSAEKVIDDLAGEVSSSFTPTIAIDPKTAAANDDVVAIAWEDRRQGTQIFASVSTDGGATFSTPIRASSKMGGVITGQSSVPQIAAAGNGVIAVTYQNQLTNMQPHVFLASSIDSGATWTYTHAQLDGGAGAALLPQITASFTTKSAVVAAWSDFRSGSHVNGDIYSVLSK